MEANSDDSYPFGGETIQPPFTTPQTSTRTPARPPQSSTARPSTSSIPREHKRAKATRRAEENRVRREASAVPLLSHQLSTFSLSMNSPDEMRSTQNLPPHLTSPFKYTPHSHNLAASSTIPPFPRQVFPTRPSTAPLPHYSTFSHAPHLLFDPSDDQGMDEVMADGSAGGESGHPSSDGPSLESAESTDWMPPLRSREEITEFRMEGSLQAYLGRRRDTDTSASSMEFSGSGTSSGSLMSLSRSSMEQQPRPDIVTLWDETVGVIDEEEAARRSLEMRGREALQMSVAKPIASTETSPFLDSGAGPSPTTLPPALPLPPTRVPSNDSPFILADHAPSTHDPRPDARTGILPRIFSISKKKSSATLRGEAPGRQAPKLDTAEEDDDTDAEMASQKSPSLRRSSWRKMMPTRNRIESGGFGQAMGLGIQFNGGPSLGEAQSLSVSLGSSSSGEVDTSPSRTLSARRPSIIARPSLTIQASPAQISTSDRPPMPRRMSTVGAHIRGPRSSTPSASIASAFREKVRPHLRRGLTEPAERPGRTGNLLSAEMAVHTPPALSFADIMPPSSVFDSRGLNKKKNLLSGMEIPRFGVQSEPVGEVRRKKPVGGSYGGRTAGAMEPPSPLSPIKLPYPAAPSAGAGVLSAGLSNAEYAQKVQKTRGLKKKRSAMFTASGSISSIDMIRANSKGSLNGVSLSPVTPSKPDGSLNFGITTPSPARTSHHYPFATYNHVDSDLFSTPPSSRNARSMGIGASNAERYRSMFAGSPVATTDTYRGPVMRASNPMFDDFRPAQITTPAKAQAVGSLLVAGGKDKVEEGITRLETDFTLVENLGSGAFSQVWKVREKKTGRVFAVKAGKPYQGVKGRLRQLEEIAILHQLSLDPHPNVIEYVDSWDSHRRLYILTTLVECGDLSSFLSLLSDLGGIREARVWKTLVELADGIDHIHKHQFLHLDIKPSNILINKDGGLVIADLGMAVVCGNGPDGRNLGGLSPALPERDEQGGFVWDNVGTPRDDGRKMLNVVPSPIMDRDVEGDREYLCPEALEMGGNRVGKAADVFSLGILLLEAALNVVLPSNGDTWQMLRLDDFSDIVGTYTPRSAPSPSADPTMPVLSDALIALIKGMMRSEPDERLKLSDVWEHEVVRRVKEGERGRALVEESEEWLGRILG
ncbi:hypothetical protein IAT38_001794 [Cryptococcus sp. DSM 104549]